MTTIAYIFLDAARDSLIPLAEQQQVLENYAKGLGRRCDELLVEQSFSPATILQERTEGKRLLENVQNGDTVLVMKAKWVLGDAQNALLLLDLLKEKEVSVFCVDLDGDIVKETERKLSISQGIAPIVHALCEALSVTVESGQHSAAIRAGKARQKEEGKYLGGPVPFGYQVADDGRLQQNGEQQSIIDEMTNMKEDRWSYRDIARKIEGQYGLKFSHEGIRRILLKNKRK
jgi:DNA invertase Pin-like site-specific DNA recombinase